MLPLSLSRGRSNLVGIAGLEITLLPVVTVGVLPPVGLVLPPVPVLDELPLCCCAMASGFCGAVVLPDLVEQAIEVRYVHAWLDHRSHNL